VLDPGKKSGSGVCASKLEVQKDLMFTGTLPSEFCWPPLLLTIMKREPVEELSETLDGTSFESNNNNSDENVGHNNNMENALDCIKKCTVVNFVTSKIHETSSSSITTTGKVVYEGLKAFFQSKATGLSCCEKTTIKSAAYTGPASPETKPDFIISMKKDDECIFLGIGEIKDTAYAPLEQQGFFFDVVVFFHSSSFTAFLPLPF
jgi:hypothetical protein